MSPQHGQQTVHHLHLQGATREVFFIRVGFGYVQLGVLMAVLRSRKNDLCSQVAGDSSRHRVARLTGWFMVQSAAGTLKSAKEKLKRKDFLSS